MFVSWSRGLRQRGQRVAAAATPAYSWGSSAPASPLQGWCSCGLVGHYAFQQGHIYDCFDFSLLQLTWCNTNKLLGSSTLPCDGIKTGTTRAAGPCLCSRFSDATDPSGSRSIIVVVMGYVMGMLYSQADGERCTGRMGCTCKCHMRWLRRQWNFSFSYVSCFTGAQGVPLCNMGLGRGKEGRVGVS